MYFSSDAVKEISLPLKVVWKFKNSPDSKTHKCCRDRWDEGRQETVKECESRQNLAEHPNMEKKDTHLNIPLYSVILVVDNRSVVSLSKVG